MIENAKENSQRVELKDRIIETASEAFTTHGIKSITMDDIAASLGISKRTLYEVFQDKESLLTQCILKRQEEMLFWQRPWPTQRMFLKSFLCVISGALRHSIGLTSVFLKI